jgi:hypothetical protein
LKRFDSLNMDVLSPHIALLNNRGTIWISIKVVVRLTFGRGSTPPNRMDSVFVAADFPPKADALRAQSLRD